MDSNQVIPTGPVLVYECLWRGCDYQYEDLKDLRIHVLDSMCHLRKSGRIIISLYRHLTVHGPKNCNSCQLFCEQNVSRLVGKRKKTHSRPQRPRSFWSAPGIETSGLLQNQKSAIHGLIVEYDKSD